ncbi:YTH domain-containing protein ECT4-like [Malania oleifera]|uniref:YTH domain-containing protein ECT4-like n=1 Tax=Malania oleifera TaxID=397392 RepID=UPI0025AE7C81|nr:YTH domain-containing protein ECT4-like [Malania oleifera]
MMDVAQQTQDRTSSTGERPVGPDNLSEQLSPKDERVVSANPSPNAAVIGPLRDGTGQHESSVCSGVISAVHPVNVHASQEQIFHYGAYANSTGTWNGYPHYLSADNLPVVSSVIYSDNSSLVFHPDYGFNSRMAYGQYSPAATPLASVMLDGQLYTPQQIPFSLPSPYYPQPLPPVVPHVSSSATVSQTELMVPKSSGQEGVGDHMPFGSGSGYFVQFGSLSGGGDVSGNSGIYNLQGVSGPVEPFSNQSNTSDANRPLTSLTCPGTCGQPIGILGSYEHNVRQISPQLRQSQGFGSISTLYGKQYLHEGSQESQPVSKFGSTSISHARVNEQNRLIVDKGRRRERDCDSVYTSFDSHDIASDRNRGPRASKLKGKGTAEQGLSSGISKNDASMFGAKRDFYNRPDFVTHYESAKFFIIKSFSEDNVHKSIKYGVWASTPHGNGKLDAAFSEAKEIKGSCPVFLLFSVNSSSQFCGLAEMVGPVDFKKNANYWQQDRWNGQFPVRWHIVKDVPNSRFRHILLENNENKPVTHSRDTQEVKLEQGIEMLKIFKDYDARTSILDDFVYYDERERSLQERKARQLARCTTDAPALHSGDPVDHVSDHLARNLKLEEDGKEVETTAKGMVGT